MAADGDDAMLLDRPLSSEFEGYPGTGVTNLMVIASRGLVDLLPRVIPVEIVNMQNKHGNTALHFALSSNNYNMIQLLLDNGADINISNNEGVTPRDLFEQLAAEDSTFKELVVLSYLKNMPNDIVSDIIVYLPSYAILKLCKSSGNFEQKYCKDENNNIWHILYYRDFRSKPERSMESMQTTYFQKLFDNWGNMYPMTVFSNKRRDIIIDLLNKYKYILNDNPKFDYVLENILNAAMWYNDTEIIEMTVNLGANNLEEAFVDLLTNLDNVPTDDEKRTLYKMIELDKKGKINFNKAYEELYKHAKRPYGREFLIETGKIDPNAGLVESLFKNDYDSAKIFINQGATNVNDELLKSVYYELMPTIIFLLENGATNIRQALEAIKSKYTYKFPSEKLQHISAIQSLLSSYLPPFTSTPITTDIN